MSVAESSLDQIVSAMGELSFDDKLRLNSELASMLKKGGKATKGSSKTRKAKDPSAEKRKPSPKVMAWIAFVRHCKETMPERFEDITKESEKLAVCKGIRAEDDSAYTTFVDNFLETASVASDAAEEKPKAKKAEKAKVEKPKVEEKPKKAEKPKAKAESDSDSDSDDDEDAKAKKAKKAAKKEAKKASKAADTPAAAAAAAAAPVAAKKSEKPVKPVKPVKAKKPEVKKSDDVMPKKTIGDVEYFHDSDNNALWLVGDDDSLGAWQGYFQPGNDDEPIRFTDSPSA